MISVRNKSEQFKYIKEYDARSVKNIKYPCYEIQDMILSRNYNFFKFINNPYPDIEKRAVKHIPSNILFCKDPSYQLIDYAVRNDVHLVYLYKNILTDETKYQCIINDFEAIIYITKLSEYYQIKVLDYYWDTKKYPIISMKIFNILTYEKSDWFRKEYNRLKLKNGYNS